MGVEEAEGGTARENTCTLWGGAESEGWLRQYHSRGVSPPPPCQAHGMTTPPQQHMFTQRLLCAWLCPKLMLHSNWEKLRHRAGLWLAQKL